MLNGKEHPDGANKELRVFVVAGEESGDAHGAQLIAAINRQQPRVTFMGLGGDAMQSKGMEILEHISNLSVVGFSEVIKHLPYFRKVMAKTIQAIKRFQPQRIILIDYPGFNMRLAKQVAAQESIIPVTYFILPQAWAWKENRVQKLDTYVQQLLSIIPFEEQWFGNRGVKATYVGHPFAEVQMPTMDRDNFFKKHGLDTQKPLLVLFPGSRQQEIDRHWPVFIDTVRLLRGRITNLQTIVGKAAHVSIPSIPEHFRIEDSDPRLTLWYGSAGLIASGTATLEAAVRDLPFIVCYRLSGLTWRLIRRMSSLSHASLVNLIAETPLVPEFLQSAMEPKNMAEALTGLLQDTAIRRNMLAGFETVRRTLGLPGVYDRAANEILKKHRTTAAINV
jgi:lipid-A-disaccharide synthase